MQIHYVKSKAWIKDAPRQGPLEKFARMQGVSCEVTRLVASANRRLDDNLSR